MKLGRRSCYVMGARQLPALGIDAGRERARGEGENRGKDVKATAVML